MNTFIESKLKMVNLLLMTKLSSITFDFDLNVLHKHAQIKITRENYK